ncbi:MAG: class I SAM-dependent methyltransferase [Lentisphaeria bacterium]
MNNENKVLASTINTTLTHYAPRTKYDWENFQILDWGDKKSQQLRFDVLTNNILLEASNLLDVGCGLGDLWRFLSSENNLPKSYTGTDLVPEMITLAKKQLPNLHFFQCNVLEQNPQPFLYDVVYASGIFNLRTDDNIAFLAYFLTKIGEITVKNSSLVLNFLNERATKKYDHCFYYDSKFIKNMVAEFYDNVTLIDNYLINDFTIIANQRKEI